MTTIRIITGSGNYDPRTLMYRYAHENIDPLHDHVPPWQTEYDRNGKLLLRHKGVLYEYDHWDIRPRNDLLDDVTIYLKEVEEVSPRRD